MSCLTSLAVSDRKLLQGRKLAFKFELFLFLPAVKFTIVLVVNERQEYEVVYKKTYTVIPLRL